MSDAMDLLAAALADAAPFDGPLTVLRARPSAGFAPEDLRAEQGFRPLHDALAGQGVAVWPVLPGEFRDLPAVAVLATRDKAETRANVARAWALTRPGGLILVAGAKTEGIESLQKDLRRLLDLDGVRPGGHGRVFWLTRTATEPAPFAEWLATAARAPRVTLPDGSALVTVAGAFSWTEADPGSRFLAESLPPLAGRVADLGAGWGYLAHAALASPKVAALDLIEADFAALECARINVTDPRAAFHWADARTVALPKGGHDWVISNPPFHEGRAADPALGAGFIEAAARLLKPAGTLILVANRALPYERTLDALFTEVERMAETPAYKILRARRPIRISARAPARTATARPRRR